MPLQEEKSRLLHHSAHQTYRGSDRLRAPWKSDTAFAVAVAVAVVEVVVQTVAVDTEVEVQEQRRQVTVVALVSAPLLTAVVALEEQRPDSVGVEQS